MRLVEITLDYPYTNGETFCEHELEIAEKHFDEIVLISMSGHFQEKSKRYLPENARLVNARRSRYELMILLQSVFQMLGKRTFREIIFSRKKLKSKEPFGYVIKELFVYYYYGNLLQRVFQHEKISKDDIIYSYWMSAPAFYIAGMKKTCFKICRTHGYDCFIDRCYQPFRREILVGLDCIVSISEAGKKDIESRLLPFTAITSDKILVSRLGIRRENLKVDIEKKKSTVLRLVSCSNINKVKRLDLIIDALLDIKVPVEWIHMGDGELGEQIRESAEKLRENALVNYYFGGALTQSEVYHFYEDNYVDVFINCSDSEGIPVSIMEAMSFGIPVIARNVGGNAEIVNAENGVLLDEKITSIELQKALLFIYELDESAYAKLRENAFNCYKDYYMASTNYNNFFDKIKILAKKKQK